MKPVRNPTAGSPSVAAPSNLESQERLLPFLLNPRSYPHRPRTVRLIQTHSAFVFVAPPYVYKVKKAVNFGFLDFSTLARRHRFCEREVRLNQRLTDDIYLGVIPICATPTGFRWGDGGPVIEYAIRMRQLGASGFLDHRIRTHAATGRDLDRVVERLARFYETQTPSAAVAGAGRISRLRTATRENFRQTRGFVGNTLSPATYRAIREFTNTCYATRADLFAARVSGGRIRDCHGDLHLEHIHLTPRALNIYDCIEFNERFRRVDVANDLAFLAMDLDFHGRPDFARRVVRRMAERLDDPGMVRLMDFYKCYRAYVRGKVESLHSVAHAAGESERRASARRAERYFRLALQYAVAGSHPMIVAVMGPPGSGKSTIAQALARELGWDVVSSDRIRKEQAGVPLHVRGDAAARQRLYSATRTQQTYHGLCTAAVAAATEGRSLIVDATFGQAEHRAALRQACARAGATCCFVELRAGLGVTRERLRRREGKPGEISDARWEDFADLIRRYNPPDEIPDGDRLRIHGNADPDTAVSKALSLLARRQATAPTG